MERSLIATFNEAELRLEAVICLSLEPYLALSDGAIAMLEEIDAVIKTTGINFNLDPDFDPIEDGDFSELSEMLMMAGFTEYFVQISHATKGWGFYETAWFYAPSVDEAARLAISKDWKEAR